jgi:hypothetical protein
VRPSFFRRYGKPSLIVAPLALAGALLGAPSSASAPAPPLAPIPTIAPRDLNAAAAPLDMARPAATAARLLQPGIPAVTLSARATPTAATAPTPLRVGIQVGHWRAAELPDEQLQLRDSTGVFAGGHAEAEVGLDIAQRIAALLASDGIVVDVLPATIPPGYAADAFVALHADGAESSDARGFKLATPLAASRASLHLLETLADEYGHATGLPRGGASTANMRGYYAFNYRRYAHAIARITPAVIIEMGFLTNADDRTLLLDRPDLAAVGIANGIVRYLNQRDPHNRAALLPPDFGVRRGAFPAGLDVRAAPRDDAATLLHIEAERPVIPFEERDGWYHVVIVGAWDIFGWVREDEVVMVEGA